MKPLTWCERTIEAGVLFLLVFTPVAFGTVEPWSEAVAELVILAMAVTWMIGNLRNWEFRVELPPGWLPATLFLGLVVLQASVPGWSLDAHATRREALKLLAIAALFLVCYNTYRTRSQIRRTLWTMIVLGAAVSVFGTVQRATWNGRLYWIGPETHASAFGPFVNRAHFATLMVIVIPAALALLLAGPGARRTPRRETTWRERLREWNSREQGPLNLVWIFVVVMGAAALASGSRGGLFALLATLAGMVVGVVGDRKTPSARSGRIVLVTGLILLGGLWIGADILYATSERLVDEVERPAESTRIRLWTDAWSLWRQAPLVGSGLATFGVAFPALRTISMPRVFAHAESDWVQLLTDTGLIGLGLAVTLLVTISVALVRGRRRTRRQWGAVLSLAALVAVVGTALQGLANYNVPVMSNWIYLAVVLAVAGPGLIKEER
jgi:O-antigen ligase